MLQVRGLRQLQLVQYQDPESIPLLEVWLPGLRGSLETVQPKAGPLLLEKTAPRHYCWDASSRTDPPPARAALSWCSAVLSCPHLSYSPSHATVSAGHGSIKPDPEPDPQTDFPTSLWTYLITTDLPGNGNAGLPSAALWGRRGRPWLARSLSCWPCQPFWLLAPRPAGHSSPCHSLTDRSRAPCPARAPQQRHNWKTDHASILGDSKLHLLLLLTSMTLQFLNRSATFKSLSYVTPIIRATQLKFYSCHQFLPWRRTRLAFSYLRADITAGKPSLTYPLSISTSNPLFVSFSFLLRPFYIPS